MRAHRVRALLMGGQACVFYGAAGFPGNASTKNFSSNPRKNENASADKLKTACP